MAHARHIRQPGPAAPERIESAVGQARHLAFELEPGLTLNEAVARPLLAAGIEAAALEIAGGAFGPFTYVMPAAAPDDTHAAWYSAAHTPPGESVIEAGAITFGRRDGAPFLHCHAFWTEADGRRTGGHAMPHETVIARPVQVRAYGAREAGIRALPDAETNFTLFTATQLTPSANAGPRIAFARIRPGVDICHALEDLCRRSGFAAGRLRGGVGSIVGARFTDAPDFTDYATEVFVREGVITPGTDGALEATLDVSLVGLSGRLTAGRLVRGDNPVLITFEVAVEEIVA